MKMTRTLGVLAGLAILGTFSARLLADTTVETAATNLFEPYGVVSAPDGTTYITDGGNHRIVKLASGTTFGSVLAGQTGIPGTNDGIGTAAMFNSPAGIVVARGGLVVADSANHTLRFVNFNGAVSTLAGAPGAFGLVNGSAATARFRFPAGLAVDAGGNIYIADSLNNVIRKLDTNNVVSTVVSSGLYQPAAVTVAENGDLWIADTRHNVIKRYDTNGVLTTIAGVSGVSGSSDATIATNALFTNPRGILWLGGNSGVLVSDSGSYTVRRIYFNTNFATFSVETYAGTAGTYGLVNGPALSAEFNNPIGLSRDVFGGGFFVADKGNNQIRRINTGVVQPPVSDPVIGWVDLIRDPFGNLVTHLNPVVNSTFNNAVTIAIKAELGTATYFTYGPTPSSQFEDTIPTPGPGVGASPPFYRDGAPPEEIPPTLVQAQPDITIKAIGAQDGRRSSQLVQARFQFKVANPVINGDNAASFTVDDATTDAEMWFTTDGSEPTNDKSVNPNTTGPRAAGDLFSFRLGDSNTTFKIKAFRSNFKPSDTVTKVFTPTNFVANKISFGFANGEASSEFVAAAGQRFYAPVVLSVLQGQQIYSFQFNVTVTNVNGLPVDGSLPGFFSSLEKPVDRGGDKVDPNGNLYLAIPPQMFIGTNQFNLPVFQSLVFSNPAVNVLGVGWVERRGSKWLYDTIKQDLISFSQAHDTLFVSSDGKVVLGAYSFVVPSGSTPGSTYQIQLDRATATSDGVSKDIYIQIPTNGSLSAGPLNGTKIVTVASRQYVVGDVAPFRWFNAGDFGDTNLANNDVVQVFQTAIYGINTPPDGSDMFDSMDSSDGSLNNSWDGSDYSIDNVKFGDGVLGIDDIWVTFRRSLDPSLKWYARYWSNGLRQAIEVPNGAPSGSGSGGGAGAAKSLLVHTGTPSVSIVADDIVAAAGTSVQVPIRVHISGGLPIRVAALGIVVEPLDGSPNLTQPIDLIASPGLGAPALRASLTSNDIAVAWLNESVTGLSGDAILGTLTLTVPASASATAAYRVHIKHFSASPNGLGLMRAAIFDGVVSCSSRTGSSWNDGISDVWRFRWFGTLSDPRSAATADPDGDGHNNLAEFTAGTNPLDYRSRLALSTSPMFGGVRLTYPTGSGRTYVIECAPQLLGPWAPIFTNGGDGNWREWTDTPPVSNRFYRVRAQ